MMMAPVRACFDGPNPNGRRSQWLKGLVARRGFNRSIVALAYKTIRTAWAASRVWSGPLGPDNSQAADLIVRRGLRFSNCCKLR
jgi:hypothetical protein